ncbi:hypothetical protein ACOBQB_23855 [Streptomyces sp. G5(2025)]|uniref:hypothetical protein n=1 Tax=Streptomyces sp. G5(2025) TaxID=3406628 RepID=UPI003C226236
MDTTHPAHEDFGTTKSSVTVYGVLSVAALVAVVVVAVNGLPVNTFMWVRAALLPVVSVLLHRLAVSASQGSRRAFERLRTLAVIMPVAIIGVDLVPGVCPPWYAVTQTLCMLPVIRVAYLTRSTPLRTAFPKGK